MPVRPFTYKGWWPRIVLDVCQLLRDGMAVLLGVIDRAVALKVEHPAAIVLAKTHRSPHSNRARHAIPPPAPLYGAHVSLELASRRRRIVRVPFPRPCTLPRKALLPCGGWCRATREWRTGRPARTHIVSFPFRARGISVPAGELVVQHVVPDTGRLTVWTRLPVTPAIL